VSVVRYTQMVCFEQTVSNDHGCYFQEGLSLVKNK
jgi:hypothetical protein